MMKNVLRLLLVPLLTLAFAGASFPQATPGTPATPTKPTSPAKTPEKRERKQKVIRARGELTSADAKAGTLKVKTKDKELSLAATSKETKSALGKVKVGDTVRVTYTEKEGKLILSSVAKARIRAQAKDTQAKPSEKKEETKPAK